MFCRRAAIIVALATSAFLAGSLPAEATTKVVKKKSFSIHGRTVKATWYQDKKGGKVTNYLEISAEDKDGSGGKCTEAWVDYATKPHLHFNPGVVVNCDGGTRTVSRFHVNDYYGISGFQLAVCEVPNTSGKITRNSKNCAGNTGGIYMRSGKKYSQFKVKANRFPNGVLYYKF